jgi:hypothetical protein
VVDDITYIKEVKRGVVNWLNKMSNLVKSEFIESLRGEMVIRKR